MGGGGGERKEHLHSTRRGFTYILIQNLPKKRGWVGSGPIGPTIESVYILVQIVS